jgi:hypothetical protein
MTAARNYSNTAASAVLTSGASAVDTTIQVDTTSGFPSVPFILVLDKDRVAEELVLCTAIVGLALTVTRAWGGTAAATHSAAATVKHVFTGTDAQDAADHVGDSTLHWNSTNTDTLELPWQWSKPGACHRADHGDSDDPCFGWPHVDPGGASLRAEGGQADPHYRGGWRHLHGDRGQREHCQFRLPGHPDEEHGPALAGPPDCQW